MEFDNDRCTEEKRARKEEEMVSVIKGKQIPFRILFLCTNGSFGFRLRETKEGFMSDGLFYNPPCILFIFEKVCVC
jgi:hypothetical protein